MVKTKYRNTGNTIAPLIGWNDYSFCITLTQIYTHSDYIDIHEVVLTRLVSDLNAEMLRRLCCEFCCCSSFCNHYNNDNSKNNLIIVRNGNVGRVYVRVERSIGPEGRGNRQGALFITGCPWPWSESVCKSVLPSYVP